MNFFFFLKKRKKKEREVNGLSCDVTRAVHGSGRVGFRPNPDSTRRRRVEGRSNPKPTAEKIGRFGFLSWLASVGSDRVPELKKASRSEEKASPESGIFAGN